MRNLKRTMFLKRLYKLWMDKAIMIPRGCGGGLVSILCPRETLLNTCWEQEQCKWLEGKSIIPVSWLQFSVLPHTTTPPSGFQGPRWPVWQWGINGWRLPSHSDTYCSCELEQVTWPISKSIFSHIRWDNYIPHNNVWVHKPFVTH